MSRQTFVKQWTHEQGLEFKLAEPEGEENPLCPFATDFADWCHELIQETKANLTEITVNLALLNLQTHFWAHFELAPLKHRAYRPKSKQRCLFAVYRDTFLVLEKLRLTLTPPRLKEPPKPPPPQTIERGIFLGEDVGGLSDLT